GAHVDPAVLVGVLVRPMLQVLLFEFETFRVGIDHEVFTRAGEDHDFVFRSGADGLEKLPDRTMIFDAQLDGTAFRVRFDKNDSIFAALELVMLLESLLVFLEFWGGDKIY